MSLSTAPDQPRQYKIAIFAAKSMDDPELIPELLFDNLAAISHIFTNGANHLVADFAQDHGIPYSVFPLTGGRSLPWSTSQIFDSVDFVYIIADKNSKSAAQIVAACERKFKVEEGQKPRWKLIHFDPSTYWRERVMKIAGIVTATTAEDLEKQPIVRQIGEVI